MEAAIAFAATAGTSTAAGSPGVTQDRFCATKCGCPGQVKWHAGAGDVLAALKPLQQFSFVCAPAPFQHALLAAMPEIDLSPYREQYRQKRDQLVRDLHPSYALSQPEGAFYAFPRLPRDGDGVPVVAGGRVRVWG